MVSTGRPPGLYILSTHPYRGPGAAGPVTGGSRGFCGGPADPIILSDDRAGKGLNIIVIFREISARPDGALLKRRAPLPP